MKQLKENIYYIGALNPNLRVFDIIMKTDFGTSYNSYLIKGEKIALVETVHDRFSENYFNNIKEITPIEDIEDIIFNHTEPDHSGSLVKLLKINPNIKVVGSTAAIKNLNNITNTTFESIAVKTGDTLDLGNDMVLDFVSAPNLHWPDSMFTHIKSNKTVFTCDFLGCHYCEPNITDEDIAYPELYWDSFAVYYNAIMSPFKKFVLDGLDKISALDFDMVCTSHGPVLKNNYKKAIDLYREWSVVAQHEKTATVFYVSAYGYTKEMAETLEKAMNDNGVKTKSYDIIEHSYPELIEKVEQSSALLFGSPTINRDALKPVWDILSMIDAISNRGKPTLIFGSYGWSGEACKLLVERANGLSLKVFEKTPKVIFKPTEKDLDELRQIASEFTKTIL